jgi:hypothetical protein
VNRSDLTSQQPLAEFRGIGSQHRPAGGVQLDDDADAGRHDVPGIHRAPAFDDPSGLVHQRVELRHVLADGAAVIEPQPGIDRDAAAQPESVADEQCGCDEAASSIVWCVDCL